MQLSVACLCKACFICVILQVERLSKLTETPVDDMDETKRLEIINSTVNVDKRLIKLFELIEADLLAKIVHSTQTIAPYKVNLPVLSSCIFCA